MNRQTQNDHPLDDTLRERYSPRAFRTEPIATDVLLQLLEAARWAPSSYNQQPWRFIVATQDDPEAYEKLFGVINESNQRWAGNAPVLMLTVAEIEHGDRTNRNAHHDVGQAVAYLTVQATALGLGVRQMGGIDREAAQQRYNIPPRFEVLNALAIGYPAAPETLPEDLQKKETAPRRRNPLSDFVFREWEDESPLLAPGRERVID